MIISPEELYADLPVVTDVPGAAKILGISERHARTMISDGRLRSVRLGRLVKVPRHAILEALDAVPGETDG